MLQGWSHNNASFRLVSPHLMSEAEIDEHIQALKTNLDSVLLVQRSRSLPLV
jgi:hypothetical protein